MEESADKAGLAEEELVYFDGCPHWRSALEHLEEALGQVRRSDSVKLQLVTNEAEAQQHHMAGSPTILIGGRDPFPGGGPAAAYTRGKRDQMAHRASRVWSSCCRDRRERTRTASRASEETGALTVGEAEVVRSGFEALRSGEHPTIEDLASHSGLAPSMVGEIVGAFMRTGRADVN